MNEIGKGCQHKGKWERPELIVLLRTGSDEMVLEGCKNDPGSGPGNMNGNCRAGSCSPGATCSLNPAS